MKVWIIFLLVAGIPGGKYYFAEGIYASEQACLAKRDLLIMLREEKNDVLGCEEEEIHQ